MLTCHGFVQVHEKSILLALLPVTLLAFDQPMVAAWLPLWATLSMYPLLKKDGLTVAYLACVLLWLAVAPPPSNQLQASQVHTHVDQDPAGSQIREHMRRGSHGYLFAMLSQFSGQQLLHYASLLSLLPAVCIHAAQCLVPPPARFLHLYDAAFVSLAFVHIAAAAVHLNIQQYSIPSTIPSTEHDKHS